MSHAPGATRVRRCRGLVVLTLLVAACSGSPSRVDRITIANPTEYDLDVHVTGRGRGPWLPLVIVEAQAEDVVREVIDQGDVWIFRFLHSGDVVGELRLDKTGLEQNGWRLEVPVEVGERLQQLGRPTAEELTGVEPVGGGLR